MASNSTNWILAAEKKTWKCDRCGLFVKPGGKDDSLGRWLTVRAPFCPRCQNAAPPLPPPIGLREKIAASIAKKKEYPPDSRAKGPRFPKKKSLDVPKDEPVDYSLLRMQEKDDCIHYRACLSEVAREPDPKKRKKCVLCSGCARYTVAKLAAR